MNTKSKNYTPNPEGPFPPLPDPLPPFQELLLPQPLQPLPEPFPPKPWPPIKFRNLRCGCYLTNYKPNSSPLVTYDGTLRVECHSNGRTASGDLYQRPVILLPIPLPIPKPGFPPKPFIPKPKPILLPGPNPAAGIPILARGRYRYYLRVTQILEWSTLGNSFTLGFEMHRFNKTGTNWSAGGTWTNEGAFTAQMTWISAPAGYPSSGNYLEGSVKNNTGTVVGRLTMGWISEHLRRATVEIDRVAASEAPLNNGAGVDWTAVGNGVNWDILLDISDADVAEPSGESWSDAECHQAMLARRDASNLDAEWRYHVLCVRRLDSTTRGIMYDAYAGDSNNIPREGCAISSHWVIPNADPWGLVKGMRFGTAAAPYFRTAVHETGHAMCLYHNTVDNGYMNTTPDIAASAPAGTFPNNIQWSYAADDQKRLRHMPDIYVRPGGLPFSTSYATTPISPTDMSTEVDGLELKVSPLLESVPLGAPVRINVTMTNKGDTPMESPASLSLKSGFVRGHVVDPSGTLRTFTPLVLCMDVEPFEVLQPGKSINNSLTLLRGGQGALFPVPGVHQIIVEVHWDGGGIDAVVTGEVNVMITSAVDESHAKAALKVLSTPDTLLTLVFGGDHLTDGIEAIQTALKNPVLRPHFAHAEAKRLAVRFGKRKANIEAAAKIIDDSTVMSPDEIKKTSTLVKDEKADSASRKSLAKILKNKVSEIGVTDEIKGIVDSL
ncbi:MAG: hypothetical protein HZB80_10015 [Deltaproteobacteria bacterium]|nr:hypothetical protein [Deltaproteobacteria bacterium]